MYRTSFEGLLVEHSRKKEYSVVLANAYSTPVWQHICHKEARWWQKQTSWLFATEIRIVPMTNVFSAQYMEFWRRCGWRSTSCGNFQCGGCQIVTDVSDDPIAFIFWVQRLRPETANTTKLWNNTGNDFSSDIKWHSTGFCSSTIKMLNKLHLFWLKL